jgi:signal transduction histidine kinase
MLSSSNLSFSRTLPLTVFNRLGELLQQMAQIIGNSALILTEDLLAQIIIPIEWQRQRFTLLISEQFSALLLGSQEAGQEECILDVLHTSLTFTSETITSFICNLSGLFDINSRTYQKISQYQHLVGSNDAGLQSKFTLLLLEYIFPLLEQEVKTPTFSFPASEFSCKPVEDALTKQIAQERLLHQVTTKIRKSLDLQVIMDTAISEVREFLQLDRLVVFKFIPSQANNRSILLDDKLIDNKHLSSNSRSQKFSENNQQYYQASIIYESLANDSICSVLHYQEDNCLIHSQQYLNKYLQGFILAVDDVEKVYIFEECLLNFLRQIQVKSKLAVPIIFENKIWGLLIGHQCHSIHHWTENEKSFVSSIAEQLAIAIHQSELMESLQAATKKLTQEKQTLEQRVVERTMALREALLAAEAANRLRSEFLATISHELLTPLTYVIGMSSTLLRWPLGELSKRQRDYLQTIHDSGEHLLEMINDILDLSQIEAGKTVLNVFEFSLIKTAQNILDSLTEKATNKKVILRLDLQVNPDNDTFTADVGRVEQILWNLLNNAIKFTPEGGTVMLRIWTEDDTAIFQVEDTGIGIPEEKLALLFEKFQQLDTPYRRRYEGTGVGLALTKQLVELHRGRIEVESTVGTGSIFTVWIPEQTKIENDK